MKTLITTLLLCLLGPVGSFRLSALDDAYFYGEVQELGHEIQLLIDSYAYADRWDVVRRINEPSKHPQNPS